MAVPELPQDFKEFLKLLNDLEVKYLLVGGYAVGHYGYPRATADMNIWIAVAPDNAQNILNAFHQFGMRSPDLDADTFQMIDKVIRMGLPPMRIEVLTSIDGVLFEDCFGEDKLLNWRVSRSQSFLWTISRKTRRPLVATKTSMILNIFHLDRIFENGLVGDTSDVH